ncbi:MAG TPA: efflux RND transporter periplasmic adaptor subunit [Armatimonadota bacterium]|jgi:HlyD family secretion protein
MKKSTPLIAAATIVVVGGGAYLAFGRRGPDPTALTQYKITKVARGQVRKTVSSTGVLQPWTTVDIKSKAGGRVTAMMVDVGTHVKKNQVIATIDRSDTQLAVNQAEADISGARAKEEQTSRTYSLQIQQTEIAIANARAALQSAKDSRAAAASRLQTAIRQSKVQPSLTSASIRQAQANLRQAQQARAALDSTNQQDRASAKSAYDQAMANAKNAGANLTRQKSLLSKGFVSQQAVDTAQASYDVAQAQVDSAKARYDTVDAQLKTDIASADARVAQANAALASAQAGAVDIATSKDSERQARSALRQADSQVKQALEALNQAVANKANNDIRKLDINSAQASITRSAATLKNAKDTLAQTTVRAPSEGVVLTKYVDTGTIITSGLSLNSTGSSIVQIGDTTRMYVDVTVDETDIANVDEGQKVEINLDAYPGVPFEGKVARVNPQAVVESNVTSIHVRVEVDNSSPTFRLLKPGMNATCDFVVDDKPDVLNVPSSAVQTDEQGATFVQIATGGKPAPADPASGLAADPDTKVGVKITKQMVEVGLTGNDATEILSGVKEGDPVVSQTIEPATSTSATSSPFGGNRGPGGGGTRAGGGAARR